MKDVVLCVCVCVHTCAHRCPLEARWLGTGVTGGFELPDVGVANQTWGTCKGSDAYSH